MFDEQCNTSTVLPLFMYTFNITYLNGSTQYISIATSGKENIDFDDTRVYTPESGWVSESYRTITITDTSSLTNRDEFTTWLKANAVKQTGGGVIEPTEPEPNGYTVTLMISDPSNTFWDQVSYSINGGEWTIIGQNTDTVVLANVTSIKFANALGIPADYTPEPLTLDIEHPDTSMGPGRLEYVEVGEQSNEDFISSDATFGLAWSIAEIEIVT